jgi:hypothetical protein
VALVNLPVVASHLVQLTLTAAGSRLLQRLHRLALTATIKVTAASGAIQVFGRHLTMVASK